MAVAVESGIRAQWRSRRQRHFRAIHRNVISSVRVGSFPLERGILSLALCEAGLARSIVRSYGGRFNILAGGIEDLPAPSRRLEIDGREHLAWSSTGGDSGGCGDREA